LFAGFLGFSQFVSGGTGLFQLMGSKMVPGNPVANMYFAMYGQNPQVSRRRRLRRGCSSDNTGSWIGSSYRFARRLEARYLRQDSSQDHLLVPNGELPRYLQTGALLTGLRRFSARYSGWSHLELCHHVVGHQPAARSPALHLGNKGKLPRTHVLSPN
jgi:hypothetical protein